MRRLIKRASIELYCRGALPAAIVALLFRTLNLRGL